VETEDKVKAEQEEVAYVLSSDNDSLAEDEGQRFNVEMINLIDSDEEPDIDPILKKGTKKPNTANDSLPIRLTRHEHKERTVGVSTEPLIGTSEELRRKARDKSVASGARESLFITDDDDTPVERKAKIRQKGKGKDVEVLRTWKGVYQDEGIIGEVRVKTEPTDTMDLDAVDGENTEDHAGDGEGLPDLASGRRRKSKARVKPLGKGNKPIIQTEEDQQEWERNEYDVAQLIRELGTREELDLDDIDDPELLEGQEGDLKQDKKEAAMFFFQFPPVMPPLESQAESRSSPIDVEEAPQTEDLTAASSVPDTPTEEKKKNKLFKPGRVGKLNVHASGRVTLSWGGTRMTVGKGQTYEFLQNVVAIDPGPTSGPPAFDDGPDQQVPKPGKAWSLGEVKGRYVIVPDWEAVMH
jgi:DNA-directed RNA polymerase III subunit RPC4